MKVPASGSLLIADPFLKDSHFARAVILLCEHQEEGTLGFIINKPFHQNLEELIPEILITKIPLYYGGPVQLDAIHFVHQLPDLIEGGMEILPGIFWGGKFDKVVELINTGDIKLDKIKFFIGCSGWSSGQLKNELAENSWILSKANAAIIFKEKPQNTWKQSLKSMGKNFAQMANYPIDPLLN